MNSVPAGAGGFAEEFDRIGHTLPGGAGIAARRRAAMARFSEAGLPTLRHEAWKYTNVAPIACRAYRLAGADRSDAATLADLRSTGWGGHEFVFVNGHYRADLSPAGGLPAGLGVRSLASVLAQGAQDSEWWAERGLDDAPAFVALNAAFAADGAVITIDDDTVVETPIHLLFVMTGDGDSLASFPRIRISAGRRARARIIESYRGTPAAAGFTDTLTEIMAGEGAVIEHCKLQEEAPKAFHVGNLFVQQARGSEVVSHSLSLGALLARHDIHVRLDAEDAGVTLNGLYMADGRRHVDHHTRIDHLKPHTRSDEYYKGILAGAGRGVFNGRVIVHPQAFKTDAQQSNKNLLLSKDAEVDTKPELEIYADDVKCAHGATVGQLDANALFYLRARGLDEPTARGLLTCAFAGDVLGRISIERLRDELVQKVAGHLPDAGHFKELL